MVVRGQEQLATSSALWLGLLAALVFSACGNDTSLPLSIDDSILVPQEQNEYLVTSDGVVVGRSFLTTRRTDLPGRPERWGLDHDLVYLAPDGDLSEVADFTQSFVTAQFLPLASNGGIDRPEGGSTRFDVQYTDRVARWDRWTAHDDQHERGVAPVPARTYDLNSSFWLWRTLPLGEGYRASYATFDPEALTTSTAHLEVAARERIDVPAGRFNAWRLDVHRGDSVATAWIEVAPPRRLVQWTDGERSLQLSSTTLVDDRH